ncbi:MAG: T9SS type A sorting domain-containing protein [Bacteroidales bacterium]|nr:T9SS type A sorting domain-containing protein [Bacteroidales bacterium]
MFFACSHHRAWLYRHRIWHTISRFQVSCADSSGNLLWSGEYQPKPTYIAAWPEGWPAIREVPGGGFVVAGNLHTGYFTSKPYLMKIGPTGDSLWFREYNWFPDSPVYSVDTIGDQGFYVCGIERTFDPNFMIMKMNSVGDTLWTRVRDLPAEQGFYSVRTTPDGGAVACGSFTRPDDTTSVSLVKYDATGNLIWERSFGSYYDAWGQSVERTGDNGFIIGGGVKFSNTDPYHGMLIKTDANGTLGNISDRGDEPGITIFPNPATNYITFRLGVAFPDRNTKITLYDLFGKPVAEEVLLPGHTKITLDTRNLSPGIYFYGVVQNNRRQNGKILIIK